MGKEEDEPLDDVDGLLKKIGGGKKESPSPVAFTPAETLAGTPPSGRGGTSPCC